jgi:hypothetical protein
MPQLEERVAVLETLVPEVKNDTEQCREGIHRLEEKVDQLVREVYYVRGTFKIATAVFLAGLGLFAAKIKSWFLP